MIKKINQLVRFTDVLSGDILIMVIRKKYKIAPISLAKKCDNFII